MKKRDLKKFAQLVRDRKTALAEAEKLVTRAFRLKEKAHKAHQEGFEVWRGASSALGLEYTTYGDEGAIYHFKDGTTLTEKEVLGNGERETG